MRFACSIIKAINTHSELVILIACLRQQWLHERASLSRYTYTATPVCSNLFNRCLYLQFNTFLMITQCSRRVSVQFNLGLKLPQASASYKKRNATVFRSHETVQLNCIVIPLPFSLLTFCCTTQVV